MSCVVAPGNGVVVQYRDTAGGTAAVHPSTVTGAARPPTWRWRAVGTTYSGYTSSDGSTWTYIPGSSHTHGNLSGTVQVGMAVTSAQQRDRLDGDLRHRQRSMTTGDRGHVPTGWTCQDVGSPTLAGEPDHLDNGVWSDLRRRRRYLGTSDQFHYVSQSLAGDGSLSAHVEYADQHQPLCQGGDDGAGQQRRQRAVLRSWW